MSDKTAAKTAPKEKAKQSNKEASKDQIVKSRDEGRAPKKPLWTLARCKKYARRYPTETLWASGAPASYKSALAHGWRDQCVVEITAMAGKVTAFPSKKTTATTTTKRAA